MIHFLTSRTLCVTCVLLVILLIPISHSCIKLVIVNALDKSVIVKNSTFILTYVSPLSSKVLCVEEGWKIIVDNLTFTMPSIPTLVILYDNRSYTRLRTCVTLLLYYVELADKSVLLYMCNTTSHYVVKIGGKVLALKLVRGFHSVVFNGRASPFTVISYEKPIRLEHTYVSFPIDPIVVGNLAGVDIPLNLSGHVISRLVQSYSVLLQNYTLLVNEYSRLKYEYSRLVNNFTYLRTLVNRLLNENRILRENLSRLLAVVRQYRFPPPSSLATLIVAGATICVCTWIIARTLLQRRRIVE